MKSDAQLRDDVIAELQWDPSIEATHVGVAVDQGIVTLTGHQHSLAQKHAIERAVERVAGVRAVAVEIDVKPTAGRPRSDTDIAAAIENGFVWHSQIPDESIRVKVDHGWVTLSGEVNWDYERAQAAKLVRSMSGVVGLTNAIGLRRQVSPEDIAQRIRAALTRHAGREARHIEVGVDSGAVTLRGKVGSHAERRAALGAAWSSPGASFVIDQLEVTD
jgi:osmotically-inducible protein OsmY